MRSNFEVIAVAALVSVVAFKLIVGPGKMLADPLAPAGQKSIFGLRIAQPTTMKDLPVELPLP
jgi:hypothetical protein